jgi:16S rRNA A1518/A1519 N6-dimethyltransferase RsmA/KsgA/DIM1 with predicted DNA glycosylase/AP lyase activity
MKGYTNLKIINGDALKADADDFDCVVSSLPYYLSGKFIEWFARQKVPRAVLIIQKDFFDKLAANVGERKYGPHSVIAQYCFRLTKGDLVPNGMFTPPPRVTSVIVRFDRKVRLEKARDISVGLKMLFSFRGKTIRATEKLLKKSSQGALPEFPNKNMRVEELDPNQAILAATMIRGVVD